MTALDRGGMTPPIWTEATVTGGRGNVGSGLFDRVFFVDVFDGARGQVRVRSLWLAPGRTGLSLVTSTGHEVALEDDGAPMMLLPQSGRLFCATGGRDLSVLPGQALILPRGRRRTVVERDGDRLFRGLVLRLPELATAGPFARGAAVDLAGVPDLAAAETIMRGLVEGEAALPAAEAMRAIAALVSGGLEAMRADLDAPARTPGGDRALRRAEALMAEHFAEDITVQDIADRAGLGMRQMQRLFAERHGLSPHAWLTRLRLEQAHLLLKGAQPAPRVTEAALSSGLTHLGRFPAQYRRRFGTLPSAGRVGLR